MPPLLPQAHAENPYFDNTAEATMPGLLPRPHLASLPAFFSLLPQ